MFRVSDFESIKLRIASPVEILSWSHGEITKPETINYRTQRAEKDGLFCERIFGPEKDWECYCGKYKRIRYKGIVCDKCGVEVTRSIVRRERMGHIKLAIPVAHIWFLRGVPSKIGTFFNIPIQQLERVIYFASYIVTQVDEKAREAASKSIEKEYRLKIKLAKSRAQKMEIKALRTKEIERIKGLKKLQVLSEIEYRDLSLKYAEVFEAGIGAEALRKIMEETDLEVMEKESKKEAEGLPLIHRKKALRRLKLIQGFKRAGIRPEWMFLTALPVMPPDLRPMVQLDGGRYATSDLNDLYRRVINRNNRLKYLEELNAPEVIKRNEKRMLQEAVDALIDNSVRRGQAVTVAVGGKRSLKSLADMLRGKQGRFRQNLLGKRVDYSGRSVIVIGPDLKLNQCGLPKKMALELFKPFIIRKIIEKELAYNVRGAGRLIEEAPDEVWAILEEVIKGKYVLLNRAPTLHRLGIQAFKPVLIEGEAIQIHPMVCLAFNADFDGDQMAVHVPLSEEAQKEAFEIMLSSRNLLKPATGIPIIVPTRDIVLGLYWLTKIKEGIKGEGKIFSDFKEAILAYNFGEVDIKAKIKVRSQQKSVATTPQQFLDKLKNSEDKGGEEATNKFSLIETCVGRILVNDVLPSNSPFINQELNSKNLESLITAFIQYYGVEKTGLILDNLKFLGFEYSTKSGITWGMDDLKVPESKQKLVENAEKEVIMIQSQYQRGLLTFEERRNRIIEVWYRVMNEIAKEVPKTLDPHGSVYSIVDSGSRGSWSQPTQMMGMKGLIANPAGQVIELPIKSSFKEGYNPLEYFISTHGARKGAADTALRTATAGYLTRRLVDVAQDVVINKEDCQDSKGWRIFKKDAEEIGQKFSAKLFGRTLARDLEIGRNQIIKSGEFINGELARRIEDSGIEEVYIRSPLSCKSERGICQKCYGYDLGANQLIRLGEAVGIVAAQAIGEPGTQLTMRTFHTGGVAGGEDITQGLPRAQEIFEVRPPKGRALIAEIEGKVVDIISRDNQKIIRIKETAGTTIESKAGDTIKRGEQKGAKRQKGRQAIRDYVVPIRIGILVERGDLVSRGQQLTEGHIDLRELFKISGREAVERYIINQIQNIYISQGASIHDKHIEVIVKQMFSRVIIKDEGDAKFSQGDIVEETQFLEENRSILEKKKKPARAEAILLGISKVALTTESFLSAASFQETARVLISASCEGKEDKLRGLKENVIIGKLIPAGTGFKIIKTQEHKNIKN